MPRSQKDKLGILLSLINQLEPLSEEVIDTFAAEAKIDVTSPALGLKASYFENALPLMKSFLESGDVDQESVSKKLDEILALTHNTDQPKLIMATVNLLERKSEEQYYDLIMSLLEKVASANSKKLSEEAHRRIAYNLMTDPRFDATETDDLATATAKRDQKFLLVLQHALAPGKAADQEFIQNVAAARKKNAPFAAGEYFGFPISADASTLLKLIDELGSTETRCKNLDKKCKEQEEEIRTLKSRIAEHERMTNSL